MSTYDSPRYGTKQVLSMQGGFEQTSVIAADTIHARHTWMKSVKVTDYNLRIVKGMTCTGSGVDGWHIVIGKSAAGTGTVSQLGSHHYYCCSHADNAVVADGSPTATTFAAGDDIVIQFLDTTALAADNMLVGADIYYVETFAAAD